MTCPPSFSFWISSLSLGLSLPLPPSPPPSFSLFLSPLSGGGVRAGGVFQSQRQELTSSHASEHHQDLGHRFTAGDDVFDWPPSRDLLSRLCGQPGQCTVSAQFELHTSLFIPHTSHFALRTSVARVKVNCNQLSFHSRSSSLVFPGVFLLCVCVVQIASGSGDNYVRLWDPLKGACAAVLGGDLNGPKEGITCVSLSPNARFLAAASLDKIIRIWDTQTQTLLGALQGHSESVYSIAFSPDGKQVVSGSLDRTLMLWDVEQVCLVQCGTVWYSVVQYGTVWYSVVRCGTVWYSVVQCGTSHCFCVGTISNSKLVQCRLGRHRLYTQPSHSDCPSPLILHFSVRLSLSLFLISFQSLA